MDASCGPSNALTNLSKYSQQDKSLQHQNALNNAPAAAQFRSVGVDQNLNRDFNAFSDGQFANQFGQHAPQVPLHHQQANLQQPNTKMQPGGVQNMNQNWVADFSSMSLQNSDWQHQFMQAGPRNVQTQAQPQAAHYGPQMGQARPMVNMGMTHMNQLNAMNNLAIPAAGNGNLTEHQEVHKYEQHSQQFEEQFAQLEQEMQDTEVHNEHDKEEFARTAQKIHDTMLSSTKEEVTNEKFQNSNFLKLMSSISNRSVELNAQGDKLINKESGQDIREQELEDIKQYLPDPLREHRSQSPNYHEPPLEQERFGGFAVQPEMAAEEQPQPRPDQASHLPDPLAHIPDGALEGISASLQAAKIISGNQVQNANWMEDADDWQSNRPRGGGLMANQAWQEVYDDYRHDDDYR